MEGQVSPENPAITGSIKSGGLGESIMKENGIEIVTHNGVTYVFDRNPSFRSVQVGIWFMVGSIDEENGQEGYAHFLEHMMFKGTKRSNVLDLAKRIDLLGGKFNAFTSKEYTSYYGRVVSDDIGEAVDFLKEIVFESIFPEEELEREKGVVLEEIKMYEDDPDDVAIEKLLQGMLGNSPFARPVLGKAEVVASATRDSLLEFYRANYVPGRFFVAASGNFKDFPFLDVKVDSEKRRQPEKIEYRVFRGAFSRDLAQVHAVFGFPAVDVNHEDRYALSVLNFILGSGMSSRLFQEVREKRGLVYSISSFLELMTSGGLMGIFFGTSSDKLSEVFDVVENVLENLQENGVSTEELSLAKAKVRRSLLMAEDDVSGRMLKIAKDYYYHGRVIPTEEILEKIDSIRVEDVQRVATQYLNWEKVSFSVVGPPGHSKGIPYPVEEESLSRFSSRGDFS